LATKELAVASRQRAVSRFLFHQRSFTKDNMTVFPFTPTLLFSVFPAEDKTKTPPF
jgi:hypothetical protein